MEGDKQQTIVNNKLSFYTGFWLFMIGSVLGVVLEGLNRVILKGYWETHVISMWGPFCTIYGLGIVGYYIGAHYLKKKNIFIQFLTFAVIGSVIEYLCGFVLKFGLHMGAWDYSKSAINFQGLLTPSMTFLWGIAGVLYCLVSDWINKTFEKIQKKGFHIVAIVLTVFMIVNSLMTAACIVRWKGRHDGHGPANKIEQKLDELYDDDFMKHRFIEWFFIDDKE